MTSIALAICIPVILALLAAVLLLWHERRFWMKESERYRESWLEAEKDLKRVVREASAAPAARQRTLRTGPNHSLKN